MITPMLAENIGSCSSKISGECQVNESGIIVQETHIKKRNTGEALPYASKIMHKFSIIETAPIYCLLCYFQL